MKRAAIVGCGNIAGFLDSPTEDKVLTHAHAYQKHPNTDLIAICDPSLEQRKKFITRWSSTIHDYSTVQEMLSNEQIDILSICSPTDFHLEGMLAALKNEYVQTIICEKPLVSTSEELEQLTPLLTSSHKNIHINFLRRYDPGVLKLQRLIHNKELGQLQCFNGKFTKGLYHNGSHMLELIEHLCGDILTLSAHNLSTLEEDFYGDFIVETTTCNGVLQNFTGENFALFELEIIFSKGRVLIKDSGHTIQIETVEPSKEYQGYYSLQLQKTLDDSMCMNLFNTITYALHSQESSLKQHLNLSKKLLDIKNKLQDNNTLTWDTYA